MRPLRLALPWLAAALLLAALFWRIDPQATRAALVQGDLARFLPLAALFIVLWLLIDGTVLSALFSRLVAPLAWGRTLLLRAATYPVMALSFDLANAALMGLVKRESQAPLSRVAGALLVHYLCDLTALAGLALAACLGLGDPALRWLVPVLAALELGLLALLVAGRLGRGWLRDRPVVTALAELRPLELALFVAARGVFYLSFALFAWLTLPAFGVVVPLLDVLARMPVVMGIGSLPITAGGLGTTQAALVALFGPFGNEPSLLAYGLVYSATLLVGRLPVGLAAWLVLRGPAPREEGTR